MSSNVTPDPSPLQTRIRREQQRWKQLLGKSAPQYLQELYIRFRDDDVQGLAAEMAYALIVSLIPSIVFIVSLFGLLGQQNDFHNTALYFIDRFTPHYVHTLLQNVLETVIEGSSEELTLVGFIGATWATTQGASILNKGMFRAFRGITHTTPPDAPCTSAVTLSFWYSSALSFSVVVVMGGILIIAVNLLLFGNLLIAWLKAILPSPWNHPELLEILRWLFIVVGLFFFSTATYAVMLRPWIKHLRWKTALPGGFTFVTLWILTSAIFGIYVEELGKFNPVYGTLGILVLLAIWLYLSSISALLGVEVIAQNVAHQDARRLKQNPPAIE